MELSEQAAMFDLVLEALYEAGNTMLQGYAKDRSEALPPLPKWQELPLTARAAFGFQAVDVATSLMSLVEHIARILATDQQQGE